MREALLHLQVMHSYGSGEVIGQDGVSTCTCMLLSLPAVVYLPLGSCSCCLYFYVCFEVIGAPVVVRRDD
jgi:hypothetical protein